MAKNQNKVIKPVGNWYNLGSSKADLSDGLLIASVAMKDLQKIGYPHQAHVWDIRKCVRNPYAVTGLRKLTGLDEAVQKYLLACPNTEKVVEYIRKYSSISCSIIIACTGGEHRSPAIAEMVAAKFRESGFKIRVEHWSLKNANMS